MINQYTQITERYLRANRRRTLLTIVGIVLSIALISTIGFFFQSLQDAEVADMQNTYGSFHLAFSDPDPELALKIANHPKVSRSGLYTQGRSFVVNKVKLVEMITTDEALELQPYRIKSGRFPGTADEAAVEKWVLQYIDPKAQPGDTIRIEDREYRLVGLIEDQVRNQIKRETILLTRDRAVTGEKTMLLAEISPKTNLAKAVKELKALGEPDKVLENSYLLAVQGVSEHEGMKNVYYVVMFVIGIVVISTIAVIYNSFQISVVERVKQFGLLRTIGATPAQIRKLVFREATLLAMVAVPLGLIFGIVAFVGVAVVFSLLIPEYVLSVKSLSVSVIWISIGVGLASIYASAFIPARFAGRVSPLVAVSSRALITREKIKRRKNRLIGKLFGFEGQLAAKNIRRNRKRYRITVFSIVISVVLFITFSSFIDQTLKFTETYNESQKLHFSVTREGSYAEDARIDETFFARLQALDGVDRVYTMYSSYNFQVVMGKEHQIPNLPVKGVMYHPITRNGMEQTRMAGALVVYDRGSLAVAGEYLTAGKIDLEEFNREHGVIIIDTNEIINRETKRDYLGPVANLRVGDEIELQTVADGEEQAPREFGRGEVRKVKVMGIVHDEPFDFRGTNNGLKMITSEEVGKYLLGSAELQPLALSIKLVDESKEDEVKAAILQMVGYQSPLRIVNYIDANRKTGSAILMVQILLYGFVIVVSCIGSVNIVNTLTTNIILRKREFATLKSIGLTQKGLRKMIVLEGLLYGIMGTIYGSVIACGFSYLINQGVGAVQESLWEIPWGAMGIAGGAALLIGYLSVLSPMARLKKENLIDVVREDY